MGDGLAFRCKKCGYNFSSFIGVGFGFPSLYRETIEAVREGKYGDKWKELLDDESAIDAEMELYVCSACGGWKNEFNLAIYEPKALNVPEDGQERFPTAVPACSGGFVMRYELKQDYKLVKIFAHKCPECGKRMHRYRETDRLKCPECKDGWMDLDEVLAWD